jgi:hypothetical protein
MNVGLVRTLTILSSGVLLLLPKDVYQVVWVCRISPPPPDLSVVFKNYQKYLTLAKSK